MYVAFYVSAGLHVLYVCTYVRMYATIYESVCTRVHLRIVMLLYTLTQESLLISGCSLCDIAFANGICVFLVLGCSIFCLRMQGLKLQVSGLFRL